MAGGGSRKLLLGATLCAFVLGGCSAMNGGASSASGDELEQFSAKQIFERGEFEISAKDYKDAAHYFGEVERLYPYSEWARRALIMQAFAYHEHKKYEEARASAQRFIDFYPADDDAAYAQYLLALSYYDQIELVGRDQKLTMQALQALRVVIEHYPDSE